VARNDSYSTNEDTPLTWARRRAGQRQRRRRRRLTACWSSGRPRHLTLNANGSFTYTPAANYNGPDSFTYKAKDRAMR
jgi:hypothetical protein